MSERRAARLEGLGIPAQWGVDFVALVFASYYVLATLGQVVATKVLARPLETWVMLGIQLPAAIATWWIAVVLARGFDSRGSRALGFVDHSARGFLAGMWAYLPLGALWWGCLFVYSLVLPALGLELPKQDVAGIAMDPTLGFFAEALVYAAIVFGAPVAEELIFRGAMHGWLRRWFGLPLTAAISATLFGLMHVDPGKASTLLFVPPLALLGAVMSWLRERPGGLWSCIAFHAMHNTTTLAVMRLAG